MTPDLALEQGSILQLNPETCRDQACAGCLLVATQVLPWGIEGFIQERGAVPHTRGKQAYYRAKWDELEHLPDGMAVWMPVDALADTGAATPGNDSSWQRTESQ